MESFADLLANHNVSVYPIRDISLDMVSAEQCVYDV